MAALTLSPRATWRTRVCAPAGSASASLPAEAACAAVEATGPYLTTTRSGAYGAGATAKLAVAPVKRRTRLRPSEHVRMLGARRNEMGRGRSLGEGCMRGMGNDEWAEAE